MIHFNKLPNPPQVLIDNGVVWTTALMDAVNAYAGYENIPSAEKNELIKNYKHIDIKNQLFFYEPMKCCFCECIPSEGGHVEVEHYHPKSLYPKETFEWDNLLPICRICNGNKSALDTIVTPIVHPVINDPEEYFTYDFLRIIASETAPDVEMANLTIHETEGLDLNNTRLILPRSALLASLHSYENELLRFTEEFNASVQKAKKLRMIAHLSSSLDSINTLTDEKSKHAGYCRWYISQSNIIQNAIALVAIPIDD